MPNATTIMNAMFAVARRIPVGVRREEIHRPDGTVDVVVGDAEYSSDPDRAVAVVDGGPDGKFKVIIERWNG